MKDLGLLMNDDMARACWEGRKTVTRRPARGFPSLRWIGTGPCSDDPGPAHPMRKCQRVAGAFHIHMDPHHWSNVTAPRIPGAGIATVGARVWIREAFLMGRASTLMPHGEHEVRWTTLGAPILYRADGHKPHRAGEHYGAPYYQTRPSIHMPKWAARTWGELVSVTPCDLSTVDDAEAAREGFDSVVTFQKVIRALYPDARWFWRLEWRPIPRPNGETR